MDAYLINLRQRQLGEPNVAARKQIPAMLWVFASLFALAFTLRLSLPAPLYDFVGVYFSGPGTGPTCILTLLPNQTYIFQTIGDVNRGYTVTGRLQVSVQEIWLMDLPTSYFFPDDRRDVRILPLKWGERRYLLLADDADWFCSRERADFCKQIASESEPRPRIHGAALLNTTDLDRQTAASPHLWNGEPLCKSTDW